jgi:hypothetical protein
MCAAMQLLSTKNGVQVASYLDAKHLYLFFHALQCTTVASAKNKNSKR